MIFRYVFDNCPLNRSTFFSYWLIGPLVIGNKLLRITSNSHRSSLWKFLNFKCVFKRAPPVQHRNQDSYLLQTTQEFFQKKIMMCWNTSIVRVEIDSNQLIQKAWYVLARLRKIISDKINITMLTVIFISWGNINHRLLQLSNLFCISK